MIKNLKKIRKEKGVSQKELAEAVGIKPTTYNTYEKNGVEPKIDDLKKIAIYLNTSLDELCDMPEEKQDLVDEELDRMKSGLSYLIGHLSKKEIGDIIKHISSMQEKSENNFKSK